MPETSPRTFCGTPEDEPLDAGIARDVDEQLWRWRAAVLDRLHKLAALLLFPQLALVLSGRGVLLSWPLRGFLLLVYLALLASTLRRSLEPRIRAVILLGLVAATDVVRLAVGQLAGSGCLSLLVLPLLALLLVGPRAGLLGGTLQIAAGLHGGLEVTCHVPRSEGF